MVYASWQAVVGKKEIPKARYKLLGIFIVYYAYECMPARK